MSSTEEVVKFKDPNSSSGCIGRSKIKLNKHQLSIINHYKKKDTLLAVHRTGAGKTLSMVVAAYCFLDKYPNKDVIFLVPTSLVSNLKKEIIKYGGNPEEPRFQIFTHTGFMQQGDIIAKKICKGNMLIIDEVHNLRNSEKGKKAFAASFCSLKAKRILLVTATPFVNSLEDFRIYVALLNQTDIKDFPKRKFEVDEEKGKTFEDALDYIEDNLEGLVSFYYDEDLENFPKKVEKIIELQMSPKYYAQYYSIQEMELKKIQDKTLKETENLKAFLNGVRRASLSIANMENKKARWIVRRIRKRDRKTIIYSNFKEMGLEKIEQKLIKRGIKYHKIDGDTPPKKRQQFVNEYNENIIKILLISAAGKEGLDTIETRDVILVDPQWNDAGEQQVIGRAVRYKSHANLPEKQRKVSIYHLFLTKPKNRIKGDSKDSSDIILQKIILEKREQNKDVMRMLKSISIEKRKK